MGNFDCDHFHLGQRHEALAAGSIKTKVLKQALMLGERSPQPRRNLPGGFLQRFHNLPLLFVTPPEFRQKDAQPGNYFTL